MPGSAAVWVCLVMLLMTSAPKIVNGDCFYVPPLQVCCGDTIEDADMVEFGGDGPSFCTGTCNGIPRQPGQYKQACCNLTLVPEPLRCCGYEQSFDPRTELCCGVLPIVPKTPDMACCDASPYNTTTHLCCYPEPPADGGPGEPYSSVVVLRDSPDAVCCGYEAPHPRDKCCGTGLSFNSSSETCCRDAERVIPGGPGVECCHVYPFDPKTQMCVNEVIVSKPSPSGCPAYDAASEICCSGQIFPNTFRCCNAAIPGKPRSTIISRDVGKKRCAPVVYRPAMVRAQ